MASACVNNVGMSPESAFLDFAPACPAFGWLRPRISFSCDFPDSAATHLSGDGSKPAAPSASVASPSVNPDPEAGAKNLPDFEFRLNDPVVMLSADELFTDGKLVPIQLNAAQPTVEEPANEIRLPGPAMTQLTTDIICSDLYAPSPRAPKCSSRWRELLGLKKQRPSQKSELHKASSALFSSKSLNPDPNSFRHLLHRQRPSSASSDPSLSLPLLRDSDSETTVSISGRRSLSSSSFSGADHNDLSRLSLDSDKPTSHGPISLSRAPPRVRFSQPRSAHHDGRISTRPSTEAAASPSTPLAATVESPRMNASGKVVFQGLERSSSSPGSFNGGPRVKYRGMERSYSSNVRVKPVLNVVPVGSLRGSAKSISVLGFGQLFSHSKKEKEASAATRVLSIRIKLEKIEDQKRTSSR